MASDTPDAYDTLLSKYGRISNLEYASHLLSWDQQVMMPPGGTGARSRQLSALSATSHELLTADEIGNLLSSLDGNVSGEQAAAVREIRRQYERATRVPTSLVEEISSATSEALPVWEKAKDRDDFGSFAPTLQRMVELKREYAAHIDPDADPYAVLFADYEPYIELDTADRVLTRLRDNLVPLIEDIAASGVEAPRPFQGTFDTGVQNELCRDALSLLGYDWERGRLDSSSHPFSTGTQFDSRITTRFQEHDPIDALTATIHEFGHAQYTLGLPQDAYGSPLGEARDLTVHESQSRLWENHIGRSRAFWERFLPSFKDRFPQVGDVSTDDAYRAVNRVYDDNFIRVEADELTYHMHIVLRFEIEQALIHGDIEVSEVPQVWNDKMEEYLGIRPETDAQGCLQDIHWSHGSFGYFPTYSLGSVLSAQLFSRVEDAIPDVYDRAREGSFDALHEWLNTNVHDHGKRYTTPELVKEATGEAYTADYFIDYTTKKYSDLYALD
ncbi:carboxypeptidase M32 [Haladaptatus sp. QDMS2]|uniref:carboxypeptidase M32 n=1 Tax=Haladaptatus sp. QDMS2 TaxID=3033391 RepID=UPI0023E7797A|nr:carboxypeptidase M32 [Haladaptatus sp. QDMS2]